MIRFLQNPTVVRRVVQVFIIGIVIIGMVMYLGSYFSNDPASASAAGVYATVGHEAIQSQDIVNYARRQVQQRFPNQNIPDSFMVIFYKQSADQLITRMAMLEEATRIGLKVTDQELADALHKGEWGKAFFPNGQFIGKEKYADYLGLNFNLTPEKFEKAIKDDLMLNKFGRVVTGGVALSPEELRSEYDKQNVKVKFNYAFIKTEDLMKQVSVNEAELKAWFEVNKSKFANSIPEQRKARYIVVDSSRVKVQVTDADLQRLYDARKDAYKTPESIDVRHILVKTKEEALDIKKKLDAGAKFDELAKKYSTDPGSKDNGGLYQGVTRGQFVPEFEKVAFSLPAGKVSDAVQSKFGFHLIKVDKHNEARVKSLNEVRAELESAARQEKASGQLATLAGQVEADAKKEGLEKAATKDGLTLVTSDWFNQGASLAGIGAQPQVMQQLFQLPAKQITGIQLNDGVAIVEVTDSKAAGTPTFEQARVQVEQQFRNERAERMLASKTQEMADRAHALNDLKKAAAEAGAKVMSSDFVAPNGQVAEVGQMSGPGSVAFGLKPGQISGAIASGRNGIVIAVTDRQEPPAADFDKQKDQLRIQLLGKKREEFMAVFIDDLRKRLTSEGAIKINKTEAQRLLGRAAEL